MKRHAGAIKAHHDVTVLSISILPGNSLFKKTVQVFTDESGVETHQVYLESKFHKLLYVLLPLQYSIIKSYVRSQLAAEKKFNIVHSNVIFPCGIIVAKLAKELNCKHVITEHWTRVDKFFKVSLYKWAAKKAMKAADAITCVSETLKITLQKYTNNRQIFIVPNVIDSTQFFYDPTVPKNDIFTFIAVASWKPFKNPFYFLDALQEIFNEKKLGTFKMLIVGKGEQLEEIRQKKYSFGIDYAGSKNAQEVKTLLNQSHVFLHGSDYETFSVIIAEALMCGLPSVVSPYGIASEAINPGNGFVTDNTVADWKKKILACCETTYNSQLISEQLRHRYDVQTVAAAFDKVYAAIQK